MRFEELFEAVPDYPRYVVSNYGRIVDVEHDVEVTQRWSDMADCLVAIFVNGHQWDAVRITDVVASAFFVDYFDGIEIYHKNGNKRDCTVLNLTFVKPEESDES